MFQRKEAAWLGGALAICFFAGGWLEWRSSYEDYMERGFSWMTVLLLVVAGIACTLAGGTRIIPTAIAIGTALPAIIAVRIVLDSMQDPTSHNLWPFELGVAIFFGIVFAWPAVAIGCLLRRATHHERM